MLSFGRQSPGPDISDYIPWFILIYARMRTLTIKFCGLTRLFDGFRLIRLQWNAFSRIR